jgi:hypothetical protein
MKTKIRREEQKTKNNNNQLHTIILTILSLFYRCFMYN